MTDKFACKEIKPALIVYGANCAWWDSIDKAGRTATTEHVRISLPACPHCGSVLLQIDEAAWWGGVDRHEAAGNERYRAFVEWLRGKCYPFGGKTYEAWKRGELQ